MDVYKNGGKTFALVAPGDLFEKAQWELQRLSGLEPTKLPEYIYAVITTLSDVWHLTDWAFSALSEDEQAKFRGAKEFRDAMASECHWLAICREIADAHKHRVLNRKADVPVSTGFVLGAGSFRESTTTWLISYGKDVFDPRLVAEHGLLFWVHYLGDRGLLERTAAEAIYRRENSIL